jgi:biopolymer transport protein ExbD
MKFRVNPQHTHHGMNLVPLIDVLFILLIFFIVTFAMARFETELEISVPAAEASKTISQRKVGEIVINVREDGTIVLNSNVLDELQLTARLNELARYNDKQAIIIRGDVTTPYEKIVRVLDATHQAGLYHVSFATMKPQPRA